MDIAWLEDFVALLDAGGFSRAAERRCISQPSLSRRIRSLEEWVGAVLIDRSTHTLRPTAAGERFRSVAEDILRRLQIGRDEALAASEATAASLRFASTHVLSLTFFPSWLRALETRHPPEAAVVLIADSMAACERLMIEGGAQFLLCHHHQNAPVRLGSDFRSLVLGSDILLAVASPTLVASARAPDRPQLAYTPESGMGRILASAWEREGRAPPAKPAVASHLANVLAAFARDSRGVAWLPMSLIRDDLASGSLVRAGDPAEDIQIEIRLWRSRARQAPPAETFWSRLQAGQT